MYIQVSKQCLHICVYNYCANRNLDFHLLVVFNRNYLVVCLIFPHHSIPPYSIPPFPFHQALSRTKYSETLLVLYGQYSSIFILDSSSLDTVCVLRSSCKPNWNIQISFLLNPEKKGGERGNVGIFSLTLTEGLMLRFLLGISIGLAPMEGLMWGFLV